MSNLDDKRPSEKASNTPTSGDPRWLEVVRLLRARWMPPTSEQIATAKRLGLEIDGLPYPVSGSVILAALSDVVDIRIDTREITPPMDSYIKALCEITGKSLPETPNRHIANAWISILHAERNAMSLETLRIDPGDTVLIDYGSVRNQKVISSISDGGQIFFKGGNGACAWPHQVRLEG